MGKTLELERSAQVVAGHHKREVDAATRLMDKALEAVVHRDHRHAVDLLKAAIQHLEAAEVVQKILKDLPREI